MWEFGVKGSVKNALERGTERAPPSVTNNSQIPAVLRDRAYSIAVKAQGLRFQVTDFKVQGTHFGVGCKALSGWAFGAFRATET